jgi:hypothetical protein
MPASKFRRYRARALRPATPQPRILRHAALLNTPIVIWFLSTIAAGAIGTLYANVSACRLAQSNDQHQIQMLLLELSKRVENAHYESELAPPDRKVAVADNFVKPDVGYAFLDFKGRSTEEIQADLVYLMKRWCVVTTDVTWDEIPNDVKTDPYTVYKRDIGRGEMTAARKTVYIYDYLYLIKDLRRSVLVASFASSQSQAMRESAEIADRFNAAERAAAVATEIASSDLVPPAACRAKLYTPF